MILSNPSMMPQVIAKGPCVGEATPVTLVNVVDPSEDKGSDLESAELPEAVDVRRVEDDREAPARQKALAGVNPEGRVTISTRKRAAAPVDNRSSSSVLIGRV